MSTDEDFELISFLVNRARSGERRAMELCDQRGYDYSLPECLDFKLRVSVDKLPNTLKKALHDSLGCEVPQAFFDRIITLLDNGHVTCSFRYETATGKLSLTSGGNIA